MSINRIKAIETFYKGYHFRSRLEARWAVFFETLGWRWEYEREGFQTIAGNYLPDFYIKDIDCYIEIKPMPDDPKNYNFDDRLVELTKEKNVILVAGNPWPKEHFIYDRDYILSKHKIEVLFYNEFSHCRRCGAVVKLIWSDWHMLHGEGVLEDHVNCDEGYDKIAVGVDFLDNEILFGRVGKAYMAARAARFED